MATNINVPIPQDKIGESFVWRDWFQKLSNKVYGSLASQDSNSVSITGGAIDGTTIGATTPSTGHFTTVQIDTPLPIASGGTNNNATPTAGAVAYGTGTAYAFTAVGTAGQVLTSAGASVPTWSTPTTGTVTSVGLSLPSEFTVTNSPVTSSGTLTATWASETAKYFFAAPNAASGTPSFRAIVASDIPSLSYVTSVTGTSPVNVATGTSTPVISLAAAYGDTLNPYGTKTANYVLAGPTTGAATVPTFRALVAGDIPNAALSKTDDTNVTLTLGGSPTTALVNAASLTLGWTGQLGISRGGTNTSTAPSAYGVVYGNSGGTAYTSLANGTTGQVLSATTSGAPVWSSTYAGTVTSVSFTGGIITVATGTTTPAFTVAGTSGGIPYFSSATTWATSAALTLNSIVIGGGAGAAPATTATGTGVVTALGINIGTAGAFVVNGGALGTPSSGTVTNLTGTASININGTVGATTANTGAFTTLSATGAITFNTTVNNQSYTTTGAGIITISSGTTGSINNINIGATTAGTGKFSTLTSTGLATLGSAPAPILIDKLSDATSYGLITFNGASASTTAAGIFGRNSGSDAGKLYITGVGAVFLQVANVTAATVDTGSNIQFQGGAVMPYAPAPAAISAAATLTNANIQAQIISATGTTYTITMPTGSTMETLAPWVTTNIGYDFYVVNTATGVITMAVNTGVTSLGSLTIAIAASAHFRIRRTGANTFVLYRLS